MINKEPCCGEPKKVKKVKNPTVAKPAESTPADDKFDDSFYKGKGGCYVLDDQGRVVPTED